MIRYENFYGYRFTINISFVNYYIPASSYYHYSQFKFTIMKKVFTLLVSLIMVAAAFAQYDPDYERKNGYDKEKDAVYNDSRYNKDDRRKIDDRYSFNIRERDREIAKINREYDYRIQAVRYKYFMPNFRKERLIQNLENQRRDEIRNIYSNYGQRRNHAGNFDINWNW